jgi:hypothetical protein
VTREYKLESGEVIPPDLLDKIHADGRLFEAAQQPAARSAVHLRKIANEVPRVRQVLADIGETLGQHAKAAQRQAEAMEIQALFLMGYSGDQIRGALESRLLILRYGLADATPKYKDGVESS